MNRDYWRDLQEVMDEKNNRKRELVYGISLAVCLYSISCLVAYAIYWFAQQLYNLAGNV